MTEFHTFRPGVDNRDSIEKILSLSPAEGGFPTGFLIEDQRKIRVVIDGLRRDMFPDAEKQYLEILTLFNREIKKRKKQGTGGLIDISRKIVDNLNPETVSAIVDPATRSAFTSAAGTRFIMGIQAYVSGKEFTPEQEGKERPKDIIIEDSFLNFAKRFGADTEDKKRELRYLLASNLEPNDPRVKQYAGKTEHLRLGSVSYVEKRPGKKGRIDTWRISEKFFTTEELRMKTDVRDISVPELQGGETVEYVRIRVNGKLFPVTRDEIAKTGGFIPNVHQWNAGDVDKVIEKFNEIDQQKTGDKTKIDATVRIHKMLLEIVRRADSARNNLAESPVIIPWTRWPELDLGRPKEQKVRAEKIIRALAFCGKGLQMLYPGEYLAGWDIYSEGTNIVIIPTAERIKEIQFLKAKKQLAAVVKGKK